MSQEAIKTIIPSVNPKINAWEAKKKNSVFVAKHLRIAAGLAPGLLGRAERMKDCASKIFYERTGEQWRFKSAWLCKDRLCPVCSWRLSIKRTAEMIKTLQYLSEKHPATKAVHIVLTVKNCPVEALRDTITQLSAGFGRLRKRQLWRDYVIGYMRAIEVSFNADTGEYHPHIHIIAIVPNSYTKQITMGDWADMWRDCAKLNYNPVVWAAHAVSKKPEITQTFDDLMPAKAAIVEAIKYTMKPDTLPAIAAAGDIGTIAAGLAGFRMISYGGAIKDARAACGFTAKDEPAEQMPAELINPADGIDRYTVCYQWCAHTRSYVHISTEK